MKAPSLTLKTPEESFSGLWKRIPSYIRLTFAAAVALGLVTHLYMFTNKFTNHDDIGHLFLADYGTASGRWLLPTVLSLDGPFSTPWLIGMLSILCLAGTACFTVSLLRIRHPLGCVVTAAVLVSFPPVTATFAYMFTSDAYFFSLLLAAFGAYAAVRWGWIGTALAAVSITLSMGIYQSYLGVAAVLMVGALLFETLDGKRSFQQLFWTGVRLAASLAAALAAYMIIVHFTSQRIPLVDYMGISEMGKIAPADLPRLIARSYKKYVTFFLKNDAACHFGFLRYWFAAAGLCAAALGVLLLWERKLGPARTILAAALAAVYPLAGGLIYVMVPGDVHMLMVYGLSYLLIAPVALADYMEGVPDKLPMKAFRAAAGWIILLTVALTAYSYMITANTAYLKIDLSMRQCTAYSTRLLDKIESCEGYRQGMPVALVGSDVEEEALTPTPELDYIQMIGVFDLGDFRTSYTYERFLRSYLGFAGEVHLGDSETAQAFAAAPQVQAMPLYPQAGSVQVIEGTVVVKLND